MDTTSTLIDLIRHGEPEGGRMFRGSTNHPLSSRGRDQMLQAVADDGGWEAVVTSPLARCAGFAQDLADARGIPLETAPALREMDFGAWEGRTADDILTNGPGDLAGFWADPERAQAPDGESLAAFRDRVSAGGAGLLERYAGRHVLVVGHGGVIRVVIAEVLGLPLANLFRIEVGYANRTRLRAEADAPPRLVAHGGQS